MNVNSRYHYQPLEDALICSGVDVKSDAIKALESDYEKHRAEVIGINYSGFLALVEKSLPALETTKVSDDAREQIIRELSVRSRAASNNEEHFPKISQFFHKVGQLFKGHHFQTESKYGQQLAAKLISLNDQIWNQEFLDLVGGKPTPSWVNIDHLTKKVNNFNEEQFNEFIPIFTKVYETASEGGIKYRLFEGLSEDKKSKIRHEFAQKNWYYPVFKILNHRDKETVNGFISDEMIEKFISHPESFLWTWSYLKRRDEGFKKFASIIIERAAQKCAEQNNDYRIRQLMEDKEFGSEIKKMLF